MSLEKAIQHGKEKRKQYKGRTSKLFDWSCRNHGSCGYCKNNRLRNFNVQKFSAIEEILEWKNQIE